MKNIKNYVGTGLIFLASWGLFENKSYGQNNSQSINDSLKYAQTQKEIIDWKMQELYEKNPVDFKNKCYNFLNKKIEKIRMEILYYESIKKPDMAEKEHLKDNKKLLAVLNKYSCKSFKPKEK